MKEAIGDRFHAVLVDNGLMRLNECPEVKENLADIGINLQVVDASTTFLSGLKGIEDSEKKRAVIGNTFIDIFEQQAFEIEKAAENTPNAGKVEWFLQGTLYPVSTSLRLSQHFINLENIYLKVPTNCITLTGRHRIDLLQRPFSNHVNRLCLIH